MLCACHFFCFKQKTAYEMRISDWSSDVCSTDLCDVGQFASPDNQSVRQKKGGPSLSLAYWNSLMKAGASPMTARTKPTLPMTQVCAVSLLSIPLFAS